MDHRQLRIKEEREREEAENVRKEAERKNWEPWIKKEWQVRFCNWIMITIRRQQDIKNWKEMRDQDPSGIRDISLDYLIKEAEDMMENVPRMPEDWKPSPQTLQLAREEEQRAGKKSKKGDSPDAFGRVADKAIPLDNNNKSEILLYYRKICSGKSRN